MVRVMLAAVMALVLSVGSAMADDVKGTLVSFKEGTLVLKIEDKEKEFKIPEALEVAGRKDKDGKETKVKAVEMLARVAKGDVKPTVVLTIEKDAVTNVKIERKPK